jgi:hypothetical protein
MSLRPTYIPLTKEFRDKIKTLKRELTYEEFLSELIKKNPEFPQTHVMKKFIPKAQPKGVKLK